jgi:phosphatidylserine/phosphatidylglycerophosphate/cardiolipin synthase-like enzyme
MLGGDPQTIFTDNITATGTAFAVTEMEQELLDRLDGATASIDAAIYGLDRASVVNALIAAHSRGVTVSIVADDDAYTDYNASDYFSVRTHNRSPSMTNSTVPNSSVRSTGMPSAA